MVTGEKPPRENRKDRLGQVSSGFRPGDFHRVANVRGAFHLEPNKYIYICIEKEPYYAT